MTAALYLRREPTTDRETRRLWPETRKFDLVAYKDRSATAPAGRWPWYASRRPRWNSRRVMLNCYRWPAIWLEPVNHPEPQQ